MKNISKIRFYEGPFYLFSNFSAHKVTFEGVEYMTAEHAYQTAKFSDPVIKEKIANAKSAFLARQYGQQKEGRISDFEHKKVTIMKAIMRAKLEQHEDVKEMLLKSGTYSIEKNHPGCNFWGIGENGKGQNIMGKIWMELRDELREKI